MEKDTNKCFNINESDELTKEKILNSTLIKELRKYKEENTKLKHEKEKLNSIIEKLEEENKALKNDFSIRKNQNPDEETMQIVENILQSNNEIKEEPLDNYDLTKKYSKCESCDNTFSDEEDLMLHVKVKHKKICHKCEFCDNTFSDDEDSKLHMQVKHGKKCEFCDNTFSDEEDLKLHMKVKHIKICLKCESCNNSFSDEEDLKLHMKVKHGRICHKCESCDNIFFDEEDLKLHMKVNHGKIKNVLNKIVAKKIAYTYILPMPPAKEFTGTLAQKNKHANIHSMKVKHGKISHKCESCDNIFSDEEDLKLHMKVNHSKIKNVLNKIVAKKNVCDSCGKHFTSNYNLKTHFKTVHEKRRDFICMDCGKCFGTLAQKNRHANTHK